MTVARFGQKKSEVLTLIVRKRNVGWIALDGLGLVRLDSGKLDDLLKDNWLILSATHFASISDSP